MFNMFLPEATQNEILPYSNYHQETKLQSSLIPGIVVGAEDEGTMACPRCGTRRDGIPHGTTVTCESCKLVMQRFGNALHLLR